MNLTIPTSIHSDEWQQTARGVGYSLGAANQSNNLALIKLSLVLATIFEQPHCKRHSTSFPVLLPLVE